MAESTDMKSILINRLKTLGVEPEIIPGLLNDIANAFVHDPDINLNQINWKLQSLGWMDIQIDYHTFAIAEAILNNSPEKSLARN